MDKCYSSMLLYSSTAIIFFRINIQRVLLILCLTKVYLCLKNKELSKYVLFFFFYIVNTMRCCNQKSNKHACSPWKIVANWFSAQFLQLSAMGVMRPPTSDPTPSPWQGPYSIVWRFTYNYAGIIPSLSLLAAALRTPLSPLRGSWLMAPEIACQDYICGGCTDYLVSASG